MKYQITLLFALIAFGPGLKASDWYASPSATSGNGSITNPWNLNIALSSTNNILPGDTLYLRGGTYQGPGFVSTLSGTSNNYVTVRSYPGEWAVLIDGATGILLTNLPGMDGTNKPGTSHPVAIAGSENWPNPSDVGDGAEDLYCYNKSGINWFVDRGLGIDSFGDVSMVTAHSSNDVVHLYNTSIIIQNGNYATFRDFEITSILSTNRFSDATNAPGGLYIPAGGFNAYGHGNKAINLIIHNVGEPGIGFWNEENGGEINGCLIWGVGQYDLSAHYHEAKGPGIYCQNDTNYNLIKNNLIFRNFSEGIHNYGAGGMAMGFHYINNCIFNNGNLSGGIYIGTIYSPSYDVEIWTNYFANNCMYLGYVALSNLDTYVSGNIFASPPTLFITHTLSGYFTNNTIFWDGNANGAYNANGLLEFSAPEANQADISFWIDRNRYYVTNDYFEDDLFSYVTKDVIGHSSTGGRLHFANDGTNTWTDWTGWDSNSTYTVGWPTNYLNVAVQQYDYDSNRWNICVISTSGQTNTTIALSDYGFANGSHYQLVDAQNWPVVIASGTYTNGAINLPLNLTNVSAIPGIQTVFPTNFNNPYILTNESTNVKKPGLFNVFVLIKTNTGSGVLYGDVSGDGQVTAYDAALAAQAAVGLITLTSQQRQAADVDGNGEVTAYDAALIAQRAVGLISKFPVEP